MPIDGTWPHVIRVPSCHTIYLYCDRNSLYILSELYCHMCQNLGAASSNRVRTSQDTIDVNCCVREYKIGEKVNERLTLFVFPPHLLVIIGCL